MIGLHRTPLQFLKFLRRFIARRVGGRHAHKSPRQIPDALGVEGFFLELRDRKIRYVILRWFDTLPYVRPGGDVDLLVHDDDIAQVEALLTEDGQQVACDLYSVGGLPGTAYRKNRSEIAGMSYFPPDRAAELLQRAHYQGLYRVPSPDDHFLSLCYHALYQKGPQSGLPSRYPQIDRETSPKHDHPAILAKLSREVKVDVAIEMEALDAYLASRGWRPSERTIAALRPHNPWIAVHFAPPG